MDQVGNVLAVDYVNPGEDAQEPKVIIIKVYQDICMQITFGTNLIQTSQKILL